MDTNDPDVPIAGVENAFDSFPPTSTRFLALVLVIGLVIGSGCSRVPALKPSGESALDGVLSAHDGSRTSGSDIWEVVICRIPDAHDEILYDLSAVRFVESADWVVRNIAPVSDYFSRWSKNHYMVEFRPAAFEVSPSFGGSEECVEEALRRSSPDADGVLVVADAQHRENREGGWGRSGRPCPERCPARSSRRAMYVGAADFVGREVPLDLIEHEIGHALGWPHSSRFNAYDSSVDVMSASAAPRDVDPSRVHAPGVTAFNRFLAGWTSGDPLVLSLGDSATVKLDADQFLLIVVSATQVITVEVVVDGRDNDHLSASGVAVHLVDWGSGVCADPVSVRDGDPPTCSGSRRHQRLIAPEPLVEGLLRTGDRVEVAGSRIHVTGSNGVGEDFSATVDVTSTSPTG